jgi:hypothetical protein
MRDRGVLINAFPEVLTLCQYLYMKQENCVEVPGMVPGTWFRYSMNEDLDIVEQFKPSFGDSEEWMPRGVDKDMTIRKLRNVVENLKDLPAREFPSCFNSRWEEIERIALDTVGLNKYKQRRKD